MLEFQRVLASIADSIRTLNETETPLTLDEMGAIMKEAERNAVATEEYLNFYNNNQSAVESQLRNEFVTGEISIFSNPKAEEIFPFAFAYQDNIKKVAFQNCLSLYSSAFQSTKIIEGSFPECRYIGSQAFYEVTSLTSIDAEKCISIGNSAFYGCSGLSLINFPVCKEIGSYAFYSCSNIQEINLPECKIIGSYAFCDCSISEVILPKCMSIGMDAFSRVQRLILPYMSAVYNLSNYDASYYSFPTAKSVYSNALYYNSAIREIYLPECIRIGYQAFYGCSNLSEITLTNCQNIDGYAFGFCSSLQSVNLPECLLIGGYAFQGCISLQSVNLPKCTSISSVAFCYCYSLQSINLPECVRIESYAFSACSSLQSISLPKCSFIGSSAFYKCTSLESISLSNCTLINSYAFYSCWALSKIYLTNNSVCTLSNISAFSYTPFRGYSSVFSGTPHIYVPSSLVASYQQATNWSYFSSYFIGI